MRPQRVFGGRKDFSNIQETIDSSKKIEKKGTLPNSLDETDIIALNPKLDEDMTEKENYRQSFL